MKTFGEISMNEWINEWMKKVSLAFTLDPGVWTVELFSCELNKIDIAFYFPLIQVEYPAISFKDILSQLLLVRLHLMR